MRARTALIAGILALAGARAAAAQQVPVASTFEQLQPLVERGETLTVIDESGRTLRGSLIELSGSALTLEVDGRRVELSQHAVRRVSQRRQDSLKNGTIAGLAVGLAAGAASLVILSQGGFHDPGEETSAEGIAAVLGLGGGVGTAVGLAIDAAVRTDRVVYSRPPTTALRVSPVVTARRRAVVVTWSF